MVVIPVPVSGVQPGVPAVFVSQPYAVTAEVPRTRESTLSVEGVVASLMALAWGHWPLPPVSVTVAGLTAVVVAVSPDLEHQG